LLERKRIAVVALVALVVGALPVLAGAAPAENYQYRFTPADQALAARIVLLRRDLPALRQSGWTGGAVKPDLSPDPLRCPGLYAPKESDLIVTGYKETDYKLPQVREVDTYATVFQSAKMQAADWSRSARMAPLLRCTRARWTAILGSGTRLVSVSPLSLPRLGTRMLAFRIVFEVTSSGLRFAIDDVGLAHGRTEVEIDDLAPLRSASDLAALKPADVAVAGAIAKKLLAAG
jgi:hypothetical protein